MKPELKQRWVEALRSGEYQQGFEKLKRSDTEDGVCQLCVVGVLADLLVKEGYGEWINDMFYCLDDKKLMTYKLIPELLAKVGLTATQARSLYSANDNKVSFDRLADYIEETISGD